MWLVIYTRAARVFDRGARPLALSRSHRHLATEDPRERLVHGLLLLRLRRGELCEPSNPRRLLHEILLRRGPFPGQTRDVLDVPPLDEVLHDRRVVVRGVRPRAVRDGGKVGEQI